MTDMFQFLFRSELRAAAAHTRKALPIKSIYIIPFGAMDMESS
jgi:hypothetical protein